MDPVPQIVVDYLTAYNARDIAGMVRCVADDIHFIDRRAGVVTAEIRGIEAFRALAARCAALVSERRQEATNCIACHDHVTLRIAYSATVAVDLANGWKAGEGIGLEGISVFTLRAGRIVAIVDQT
jgi:ketosteroid isomerase-like protein